MTGIGKDLFNTLIRLSRGERNCADMRFLFKMMDGKLHKKKFKYLTKKLILLKILNICNKTTVFCNYF